MPHDGAQVYCSTTGEPIRSKSSKGVIKPQPVQPAAAPAPRAPIEAAPPSSRRAGPLHLLGRTIGGKYKVRSVLGEGGMGTVFEAEQVALGRSVAVKVLHAAQVTKRDAIRRFQQEARAAGAIGHPNICGVIDLGTLEDGSPYIVMERLSGETLADRLASEGGLPFEDVIDIHIQVLSGLVPAHEQGIVHRDIKPENVFLTRRVGCPPIVKLLDFGVSKMIGVAREELALTRTGMVMGTPYYMAPEQARGERDLDARVDLYACGVMFYEALTGKRPFTASNYNALLVQILGASPRPARALRPALPAAYDAVIERAMARDRRDRYATAADFQHDLQALRDRHNSPRISGSREVERRAAPPARGPRGAREVEAPSSSVEIPITITAETPVGFFPVDPTEVHARPPEPGAADRDDDAEDQGDGEPTQLMAPTPRRR
jgi:serine/threonine-protein kinase